MTDERNGNGKSNINSTSNNNSTTSITNNSNISSNSANSSTSPNSSNNERLIAEAAAKFFLKNGINGTNTAAAAAAATLLTAAAAFQLPATPELKSASAKAVATTIATTPTASSSSVSSNGTSPTLPSTKNNSSSSSSSLSMATASAAAFVTGTVIAAPKAPADVMASVLDYSTLNGPHAVVSATTKSNKFGSTGNGSSSFDMGRHPISMHSNNSMSGYGGRLQFFKDGKFILELARAKDGDKGGWVSVPRKPFRTPSAATSATVTPTSAVTTTYPKNENSTSLSFSDDNSSIQSSPWQRDQPWKQTRPRRGISKELSHYYQRPRYNVLRQSARLAALRKRRRPYEATLIGEDLKMIFERVSAHENGDETLKSAEIDTKESVVKSVEIEEVMKEEPNVEKLTTSTEACSTDTTESTDVTPKSEAKLDKMNTSEDEDVISVTVDNTTPITSSSLVNGIATDLNGEPKPNTFKSEKDNASDKRKSSTESTAIRKTTDKRLKKQKTRAKLNIIIQKLINNVPARLEQLLKTPAAATVSTGTVPSTMSTADRMNANSSGGGAIGGLSHSVAHKVSPPSSAAATSRLVEYHQHHQHVSPRKRILREFEKVSLEDNNGCVNNGSGVGGGISGGAGGKRSRAKSGGSTSTGAVATGKSMAMNLAPPKVLTTPTTSLTAVAATTAATTTTQPTRLNSSYSIHSLLGGSGSSTSKKSHDQPATIISNVHHPQHQHSLYSSSVNYPRPMLNSPKSPETSGSNGGKSPSHAASKKQRSPPYAAVVSPLPIDYGRRTPPDSYKLVQAHAQQLPHHSFYAPYVGASVSPHIPQGTGIGGTRDLLSPPRSSSASPREAPAANNTPHRTVPKKTASIRREFASPTASNSSSTANSCSSPSERSTSSPERRHLQLQRGSPSAAPAVANNSPLHYYMYPPPQLNGNGTGSPHGSASNATPTTSSAAVAAAAAAAAAAAYIPSVVSPTLYHPYTSTLAALRYNSMLVQHYQAGASPLLAPPPPHPHSHPQASSAAGARLSPQSPYHPFNYNGVNAAAVAVAAAAAFGQPTSNSHMGHPTHPGALAHHNMPPTHLAEHRTHTPKLTDICTDQMSAASSHRTTVATSAAGSSISAPSAGTAHNSGGVVGGNAVGSGSSASSVQSAMFQNNSLRNELSSDLPLNLSKH